MPAPIIRKISSLKHRIIPVKPYYASGSDIVEWSTNVSSSITSSINYLFDGDLNTTSEVLSSVSGSELTLTFDLGKERTIDHIRIFNGPHVMSSSTNLTDGPIGLISSSLPYKFKFWSGGSNPLLSGSIGVELSSSGDTYIQHTASFTDPLIYRPGSLSAQYLTIHVSSTFGENNGNFGSSSYDGDFKVFKEIDIYESFDTKDYNVQFDDALLSLQGWAGPRYEGCKTISKKVNQYSSQNWNNCGVGCAQIGMTQPAGGGSFILGNMFKSHFNLNKTGDITYGQSPNVQNFTTALYIANSVIGGEEDDQFATIRHHSYISINKILIINHLDDTVKILDKGAEGFNEFHRYITTDFPTGGNFKVRMIDNYIEENLKNQYTVKMNKGWLLKSFEYDAAGGPLPGINKDKETWMTTNPQVLPNPLSLYDLVAGSTIEGVDGAVEGVDSAANFPSLFAYGFNVSQSINEANYSASIPTYNFGPYYEESSSRLPTDDYEGFNFISSSYNPQKGGQLQFRYGTVNPIGDGIADFVFQPLYTGDNTKFISNKYTREFIDASNIYPKSVNSFDFDGIEELELRYGGTVNFPAIYTSSLLNPSVTASLFIGNMVQYLNSHSLDTELHLTLFEGTKDFSGRKDELSISTFEVDKQLNPSYLNFNDNAGPASNNIGPLSKILKLKNQPQFKPTFQPKRDTDNRVHYEYVENQHYRAAVQEIQNPFVFGPGTKTGSTDYSHDHGWNDGNQYPMTSSAYFLSSSLNSQNFSGSFQYQLSFLDKAHVLIADIEKGEELMDGTGDSGVVLIPEFAKTIVKNNIEYYLEVAGIISKTTPTKKNTTNPD
tara:strand:+ start:2585 stop:5080 length:2496 start_codon:yes stop_codon:yes gene_type:complete